MERKMVRNCNCEEGNIQNKKQKKFLPETKAVKNRSVSREEKRDRKFIYGYILNGCCFKMSHKRALTVSIYNVSYRFSELCHVRLRPWQAGFFGPFVYCLWFFFFLCFALHSGYESSLLKVVICGPELKLLSVWSFTRSLNVHVHFLWFPSSQKHARRCTGYHCTLFFSW